MLLSVSRCAIHKTCHVSCTQAAKVQLRHAVYSKSKISYL